MVMVQTYYMYTCYSTRCNETSSLIIDTYFSARTDAGLLGMSGLCSVISRWM